MTGLVSTLFITGYLFFFPIPLFVRRFGKFMPADASTAAVRSFHIPRFAAPNDEERKKRRRRLWRKLLLSAFCWGLTGGLLLNGVFFLGHPPFLFVLLFIGALLAATDERYHLLPDFLTVPLLITGFFAAAAGLSFLTPQESAVGAVFGFALPTLSGVLMAPFKGRSMGGGDFKMLAATGAWIGVIGLVTAIVASCFFFAGFMLTRKKTSGPYGLSLVLGMIVFLILTAVPSFRALFVV